MAVSKQLYLAALLFLAVCLSAAPAAHASPEEAIKARQAHFKDLGKAMKELADGYKASLPDRASATRDARQINDLAQQLPSWFPVESAPSSGFKTQARPEIWSKPNEFQEAAAGFKLAAAKLNATVAAGSMADIGAALGATGKSCGGCHQEFRVKDKDEH